MKVWDWICSKRTVYTDNFNYLLREIALYFVVVQLIITAWGKM